MVSARPAIGSDRTYADTARGRARVSLVVVPESLSGISLSADTLTREEPRDTTERRLSRCNAYAMSRPPPDPVAPAAPASPFPFPPPLPLLPDAARPRSWSSIMSGDTAGK